MLGISPNCKYVEEAWSLIPVPRHARSDLHEALYELHAGQRSALESRAWGPELSGYPKQLANSRSWGPYATGPVPIPFMWNAVGRAAGSVLHRREDAGGRGTRASRSDFSRACEESALVSGGNLQANGR